MVRAHVGCLGGRHRHPRSMRRMDLNNTSPRSSPATPPDDQGSQRAKHHGGPEKSTPGNGKCAGIFLCVGFGNLPGADPLRPWSLRRKLYHQPAIEADQTDAAGAQQDRQHLGAY